MSLDVASNTNSASRPTDTQSSTLSIHSVALNNLSARDSATEISTADFKVDLVTRLSEAQANDSLNSMWMYSNSTDLSLYCRSHVQHIQ